MTVAEHILAHTRDGDRSLVDPERARWLWPRLREAFPRADAFVLMPDHPHLVAPQGEAERFGRILRHFTARFGTRFDIPEEPTLVNSPKILVRTLRYCFRNPVDDRRTTDPWSWPWSTLRDLGGSVWDPWTRLPRTARRCRISRQALLDHVTRLEGVAVPCPVPVPRTLVASLAACRSAVSATLRCTTDATHRRGRPRRLLIQLLDAVGPRSAVALAKALHCNRRTVERARTEQDPALPFALRSLADPRLRVHDVCARSRHDPAINRADLGIVSRNGTSGWRG